MEKFFTEYEHTISAISTIATVAAVVISLWVTTASANAHRTNIKANANIKIFVFPHLPEDQMPRFLMVDVTNIGLMRAKVNSFCLLWNYPFAEHSYLFQPHDAFVGDPIVPYAAYPVTIEPNESHGIVFISEDAFFKMFTDEKIQSFLGRLFARFMTLKINTDDGRVFKVKLNKQIRSIIKERTRLFGKK